MRSVQLQRKQDLWLHIRKISMEICFIPDDDYAGFIDRECNGQVPPPGNFVSTDGKILGRHKGITHYTIGQRKGLGIAFGYPVFVTEIRPDTNEVVLGTNEDVFTNELYADHINSCLFRILEEQWSLKPKIRYSHSGSMCKVTVSVKTESIVNLKSRYVQSHRDRQLYCMMEIM